MSSEHKRPLAAFLVLAVACALFMGYTSWRADAVRIAGDVLVGAADLPRLPDLGAVLQPDEQPDGALVSDTDDDRQSTTSPERTEVKPGPSAADRPSADPTARPAARPGFGAKRRVKAHREEPTVALRGAGRNAVRRSTPPVERPEPKTTQPKTTQPVNKFAPSLGRDRGHHRSHDRGHDRSGHDNGRSQRDFGRSHHDRGSSHQDKGRFHDNRGHSRRDFGRAHNTHDRVQGNRFHHDRGHSRSDRGAAHRRGPRH